MHMLLKDDFYLSLDIKKVIAKLVHAKGIKPSAGMNA